MEREEREPDLEEEREDDEDEPADEPDYTGEGPAGDLKGG